MRLRLPGETTKPSHPDLCVIGASDAGRAAAMASVALGLDTMLIDAGGSCDPDLLLEALRIESIGFRTGMGADPDTFAGLRDRVRQRVERAAIERQLSRLAAMTINVVRGTARFRDPVSVVVDDRVITARRFFVATGAPARPQFFEHPDHVAVGAMLDWTERPAHLVVMGGDARAVSMAQRMAQIGAPVTLIASAILPDVDPELVEPLLRQLRRDGVVLRSDITRDRPECDRERQRSNPLGRGDPPMLARDRAGRSAASAGLARIGKGRHQGPGRTPRSHTIAADDEYPRLRPRGCRRRDVHGRKPGARRTGFAGRLVSAADVASGAARPVRQSHRSGDRDRRLVGTGSATGRLHMCVALALGRDGRWHDRGQHPVTSRSSPIGEDASSARASSGLGLAT